MSSSDVKSSNVNTVTLLDKIILDVILETHQELQLHDITHRINNNIKEKIQKTLEKCHPVQNASRCNLGFLYDYEIVPCPEKGGKAFVTYMYRDILTFTKDEFLQLLNACTSVEDKKKLIQWAYSYGPRFPGADSISFDGSDTVYTNHSGSATQKTNQIFFVILPLRYSNWRRNDIGLWRF
ncbi:hypothetical protein RFI_14503 [Reticulomyxa filosa]|uniref:Uncharacterized protein n=1 Tax=Reticulomyxa filosa TaxID=46433 RepID=X6NA94_RETFI|nr:hypothetical protein RFI_14503 [Reticulomyxa filosa]|eukprot:ETO22689.1 hypothetical protein RFI_14503 [Reticulomyxa filosa]